MANLNKKAVDSLIEWIGKLFDKKINEIPLTKVFPSTIYSLNADKTYTIIKDKQKYNVKNGLGTTLSLGQNVWIMIPNGDLKDMFVCGVR